MFDSNGNMIDKNNKKNNILAKITLVILGAFIIVSVGMVFFDQYKLNEEIAARTKWYIENGSVFSNTEYVNNDGGYVEVTDNDVVEIKKNGDIVAKNGGKATITVAKESQDEYGDFSNKPSTSNKKPTASQNDKLTKVYDNLQEGEKAEIDVVVDEKVSSIVLKTTELNLFVGESSNLEYGIMPSTATNKKVSWESGDNSVITVDGNGKVTAKGEGIAYVKVTALDGSNRSAKCKVSVTKKEVIKRSITLIESSKTLQVGENYVLNPIVSPDANLKNKIVYTSSDNSVATVDSNGNVYAKNNGNATITLDLKEENLTATFKVTVNTIDVSSIQVSPHSITLEIGNTVPLQTTIYPSNATDKNVTYTSSNNSIATVSNNGIVTAISSGDCNITVSSGNNKTDVVSVKVNEKVIPVTKVDARIGSTSIKVGNTTNLVVDVYPSDATNKTITYTSSNNSIATIDNNGVIKGISPGNVVIYATSSSGLQTRFNLLVTQNLITKLSLSSQSTNIQIGQTTQLTATVTPSNASIKTITYKSSDDNIATVSQNGIVTGKSQGVVTITASTNDGSNLNASVKIQVSPTRVSNVQVDKTNVTMYINGTANLKTTVYPSTATNKGVTYSSSNTKVATVSSSGVIKGIASGTATITITSNDNNNITTSVTVKVQEQTVKSISLSKKSVILDKGSSIEITSTVKYDVTNVPSLPATWKSSDTSIATVDSKGNVYAKKAGKTSITLTVGKKSKSIPVYVSNSGNKIFFIDVQDNVVGTDGNLIGNYANGDAILIRSTQNGKYVYGLIDIGKNYQYSYKRIIALLNDLGVKELEWLLLTHNHADHYGGLYYLDSNNIGIYETDIKIKGLYLKQYDRATSNTDADNVTTYRNKSSTFFKTYLDRSKNNGTLIYCVGNWSDSKTLGTAKGNDKTNYCYKNNVSTLSLGDFKFKLYNTSDAYSGLQSVCKNSLNCNENSNSIVAVATVNGRNIVFSGDIDNNIDKKGNKSNCGNDTSPKSCFLSNIADKIKKDYGKIDIYKMAHHAIPGNNPLNVIKTYSPTYAVGTITSKWVKDKKYQTIDRLKNVGVKEKNIYYSGDGTVLFNIDNSGNISTLQFNKEEG